MPQRYLVLTIIILSLLLINISIKPEIINSKDNRITIKTQVTEIPPAVEPLIIPEPKKEKEKEKTPIYVKDMTEALRLAKEENRKILLFFHTNWCGNCELMLEYFNNKNPNKNDPNVIKTLSNYVIVIINTDIDHAAAKKYNIYAIPRYIQLDVNSKIIKDNTGYINPKQFVLWLTNKPNITQQKSSDNINGLRPNEVPIWKI